MIVPCVSIAAQKSGEFFMMGRKEMVRNMNANWFSYYYFFAQVCPLLRRT
jgi:hypothetical protein